MKNTATKHQKHAKLARPELGVFARNEWAFIGAPCGLIQSLSRQILGELEKDYKVAYVDADHSAADEASGEKKPLHPGHLIYTDKINFHRFDLRVEADSFKYRQWFNEQDLVLVNGNHFKADRQFIFIDPRKFESLGRKLDRLTRVAGFIKVDPKEEIPGFLRNHLPHWRQLPVWHINEAAAVSEFIRQAMKAAIPAINGLVLAGGKSQRMGQDKGLLSYHGLPQREYLYREMEAAGLPAFLSGRATQQKDMPAHHHFLPDSFLGLGPFGAILSAFRQDPNRAWLVVACDLPYVNREGLEYLIAHRDPTAVATAFYNPETDFPDPLLTLWEPRAYPVLLQFLAQGYSCPRKALINSAIKQIDAPNDRILTNVNDPEALEKVRSQLAQVRR